MKNNKNSSKEKSGLSLRYQIAIGILILTLPALLTQLPLSILDFTQVGQVGDTIGGVTAPFVGLLGAYLIYQAFDAQVKANKIQSEANDIQQKTAEFDVALKLIDDLGNKLSANVYRHEDLVDSKRPDILNSNFYEIIRFWPLMKSYRRDYLVKIVLVTREVKFLVRFVEESQYLTQQDKARLLERAVLLFGSDLAKEFETFLSTTGKITNWPQYEKNFVSFCQKFYDNTLNGLLYYLIHLDELNDDTAANPSNEKVVS